MTTYVDFDLAKLLEQKGFVSKVNRYWNCGYNDGIKPSLSMFRNEHIGSVSAPTIAEVVMWLYEKHEVWVEVYYDNSKKEFYIVWDGEEYKFNTPTEAYIKAIEYVLLNLL